MRVEKVAKVVVVGAGPVGLLTSRLLASYGVSHILVERRSGERKHPQAHYLNMRTMEILRSSVFDLFRQSLTTAPPSATWRDFVYAHSLYGSEYVRIDQVRPFSEPESLLTVSPTSVLHLPQHHFESMMIREHGCFLKENVGHSHSSCTVEVLSGWDAELESVQHDRCTLRLSPNSSTTQQHPATRLHCEFLVSAEGVHSRIRQKLQVPWEGTAENMQHLMNVHFFCPGLRQSLLPRRPGMLYFIFHPQVVAVLVCHDPMKDEWVCQMPYFPPFQRPEDFTETKVRSLLQAALFDSQKSHLHIDIRQVNSWSMHAQVARDFHYPKHPSSILPRVFFVGDSAHRFPPAGGFGMNTGIQDAHNLAWKLAVAVGSQSNPSPAGDTAIRQLLQSYESERQDVAKQNTVFAIRNYEKTVKCAAAMGLDPAIALRSRDVLEKSSWIPLSMRRDSFQLAAQTAMQTLSFLRDWKHHPYGRFRVEQLKQTLAEGNTLPLIFPDEDVGFAYSSLVRRQQNKHPFVGKRVSHVWVRLGKSSTDSSDEVLSSVDIAAMVHRMQRDARSGVTPPPYVLWMSSAVNEQLQSALAQLAADDSRAFVVVVVHAVPTCGSSTQNHNELQKMWQVPQFAPPDDVHAAENESLTALNDRVIANLHSMKQVEVGSLLGDKHAKAFQHRWKWLSGNMVQEDGDVAVVQGVVHSRVLHVTDIAGKLGSTLQSAIMMVRPDDHVQSVLSLPSEVAPQAQLVGAWLRREIPQLSHLVD